MKRALYYTYIVMQGIVLAVTLSNVIYCIATNSLLGFGITSYPALFVPFLKVYDGGALWNYFVFLLLACFSVFVYIKATREYLDRGLRKAKFISINFLWLILSYSCCFFLIFDDCFMELLENNIPMVSGILFTLGGITSFVKIYEAYDVIRADRRDGEDFLPEEAQLDAKSYKQIERTAKGMPWFAFVCFIVSLYIWYVDIDSYLGMIYINLIYIGTALILIINFFICIDQTKKFEKRTGQPMPSEDFLKRINVLQIVTFIVFLASYFVFLIISGF